jgi:CysZ protein
MAKGKIGTAIIKQPGAFVTGVLAPFRALRTTRDIPGLKRFFIIPFLINILLLTGAFVLGYMFMGDAVQSLVPQGDAWYLTALRWIIQPLIALLLALVLVFAYSITGSIITAPFNDIISAKVERALAGGTPDDRFTLAGFFDDMLRILFNTIKLVLLLVVFQLAILLVNLVPVAGGPLYTALSYCAAMFFLGFQFFDFPLERRRLFFRDKLKVVWRHKFTAIGLGTGFFLITFVPLVGFLGLNLATVGATELFVRRVLPGLDDLL